MKVPTYLKNYLIYHKDAILPTEKYYVYFHKNPITEKIFYVGSARGNQFRAYEFSKHRNQSWKKEVLSFGGTCNIIVEIIKYCSNPIEAQEIEFRWIYDLKRRGEAYCCEEGDYSFIKKRPTLQYDLYLNCKHSVFKKKKELIYYCKEELGISRTIVNSLIKSGEEYRGTHKRACGLRIIKQGKEKEE